MTDHTDHSDDTVDLLRRTFAAHDDVADTRAAALMDQAVSIKERPARRLPPILLGVAAALLAVAVVVGGIVWGGTDATTTPPVPAGPTVSSGLLSKTEEDALSAQIDRAVTDAGTLTFHMREPQVGPGYSEPPLDPGRPEKAATVEIDERGDQHRIRHITYDSWVQEITLSVGADVWTSSPFESGATPQSWAHSVQEEESAGLGSVLEMNSGSAVVYALGTDDVDGAEVRHYRAVRDDRLDEGVVPPADTEYQQGRAGRIDVWVDPVGRLVKVEHLDGDGLIVMDGFEYGAEIDPIEPPPADQVEGPGSTAG